jgi:CHAD domain-containing protein
VNPAAREMHASIAAALARLAQPRISDEAVHETRKALKKARAALRLLRPGLEPAVYRAQNALLRDAGRCLSPLREPKSMLETLAALQAHAPEALSQVKLDRLRKSLRAEKASATRDLAGRRAALAKCIRLLKYSLARAEQPDFSRIGPEPLADGIRRIYRKGRRSLAQARKSRAPEAFHEWRKQTKYLLNALETLYGSKAKRAGKRAEKLADRLGDEHDLDALGKRTQTLKTPQSLKTLQALIARRRSRLQKQALSLGKKLYVEKPKRFVRRIA